MKEQQTEYFELQELRVKRGEKQNGSLHVDGTPYVLPMRQCSVVSAPERRCF